MLGAALKACICDVRTEWKVGVQSTPRAHVSFTVYRHFLFRDRSKLGSVCMCAPLLFLTFPICKTSRSSLDPWQDTTQWWQG